LRLLEAIRILGLAPRTRFYQASTSELYGLVDETPQRETTPFRPRSPYAAAKLYAYWITVNYREAYGFHACNGILFNHEGPRRGVDEVGIDRRSGEILVKVDPRYFRPTEVETLLGDSGKARQRLGWRPTVGFSSLVEEMVREDVKRTELGRNFGHE